MSTPYQRPDATDILDLYFIENRARLLDIASFLDRIDRHEGAEEARRDFRYRSLARAIELLGDAGGGRTAAVQRFFSDQSTDPLESAVGLKAVGAWEGAFHEGN